MSKAKEFARKNSSQFFKPGTQPQVAKTELVMALQLLERRLQEVESELKFTRSASRKADWRSIALLRLMSDKLTLPESEITNKIEEVQIEAYNADSAQDDLNKNLVDTTELADTEMTAIIQLKTYLNGQQVANGSILRSKIVIGQHTIVKELDEALLGMKVGESKKFPLVMQGQTDEAEVTLYALKVFAEPVQEESTSVN